MRTPSSPVASMGVGNRSSSINAGSSWRYPSGVLGGGWRRRSLMRPGGGGGGGGGDALSKIR